MEHRYRQRSHRAKWLARRKKKVRMAGGRRRFGRRNGCCAKISRACRTSAQCSWKDVARFYKLAPRTHNSIAGIGSLDGGMAALSLEK